jgi:hypothetical protein
VASQIRRKAQQRMKKLPVISIWARPLDRFRVVEAGSSKNEKEQK